MCTHEDLFSEQDTFSIYQKLSLPIMTEISSKKVASFFRIQELLHKIIQISITKNSSNQFIFFANVYHIKRELEPNVFQIEHTSLLTGISQIIQKIFPHCIPPKITNTIIKRQFLLFTNNHPKYHKHIITLLNELRQISTEPIHLISAFSNNYHQIPTTVDISNYFHENIQKTLQNKTTQKHYRFNIFSKKYRELLHHKKSNIKIIPIILLDYAPKESNEKIQLKANIRSTLYKIPILLFASKFLSPQEANFWKTVIFKKSSYSENIFFPIQYKQKVQNSNNHPLNLIVSTSTLFVQNSQHKLLEKYYITKSQYPQIQLNSNPAQIYQEIINNGNKQTSLVANSKIKLLLHPSLYKDSHKSTSNFKNNNSIRYQELLLQVQNKHIWIQIPQKQSVNLKLNKKYYFFTKFYTDIKYENTILKNDPVDTKVFTSTKKLPKLLFLSNNNLEFLSPPKQKLWNQNYVIFGGIIKEVR